MEHGRDQEMKDTFTDSIILFACRYAFTRQTGAAFVCTQHIKAVWDDLPGLVQTQLKSEIRSEARYCQEDWDCILELKVKGETTYDRS